MIHEAWLFVRRIITVVLFFTLAIFLIELFRIFIFFLRLSPLLGWTYLAILAGLTVWFLHYIHTQWFSHPRALLPPPLPEKRIHATSKELKAYAHYLARYIERLQGNEQLNEEDAEHLAPYLYGIKELLGRRFSPVDMLQRIDQTETEGIAPVLEHLNSKAEEEIRHSVRDVMLGVTLSPWHGMDMVIVLYRNACMILRIGRLYNSRPSAREEWLILRDTVRVVAAVNLINMGKTLIESLFTRVPLVGRYMDDIGQGLGAGLLTSAAGHAAATRCAAFQAWRRDAAVQSLASQAQQFFKDVRDLFTRDVLPGLKKRVATEEKMESDIQQPGFWDQVARGITTSIETTAQGVDRLIVNPAIAGTRGVTDLGGAAARHVAEAGRHVARRTSRHSRHASQGTRRVVHTFGQRLKYTLFPGYRK
jgi:hypothetical protein